MPMIPRRHGWKISEAEATPESVYLNRRQVMTQAVAAGISGLLALQPWNNTAWATKNPLITGKQAHPPAADKYPASKNTKFTLDRPLTDERVAAMFNNFYEFSTYSKTNIWKLVETWPTNPWTVEIAGLVPKPKIYDIDVLIRKMSLEERLYRHRCVETWAMAVPWTGFRMKDLINLIQPLSSARFVKFTTFMDPDHAPSQKPILGLFSSERWPYVEGLTMAEATNELTLMATGIYGHPILKQHGAPLRLVAPWKYGYKNAKSIVKIEFVNEQPRTYWNQAVPSEYDFLANVNPKIPHKRWSQETEWIIPDRSVRRPTMLYNGYGEWVAQLYKNA